jgi:hypothetical protein
MFSNSALIVHTVGDAPLQKNLKLLVQTSYNMYSVLGILLFIEPAPDPE